MSKKYVRKYPNARYLGKVGAPKGGRVHWFLEKLNFFPLVKRKYEVDFAYETHNYVLKLKDCKKGRSDMYFILRTPKTWSVRYYDEATSFQEQVTFSKADEVIDYILYRMPKKIEQENYYEQELEVKRAKKQNDTLK